MAILYYSISNIFWLINSNPNLMQSPKKVLLYYIYHKYTHFSLILIFKYFLK
jgi:hypothetical protein